MSGDQQDPILEQTKAELLEIMAERKLGRRCWVCERPTVPDGDNQIQLCPACDKPGLSC